MNTTDEMLGSEPREDFGNIRGLDYLGLNSEGDGITHLNFRLDFTKNGRTNRDTPTEVLEKIIPIIIEESIRFNASLEIEDNFMFQFSTPKGNKEILINYDHLAKKISMQNIRDITDLLSARNIDDPLEFNLVEDNI